MSKVGPDGLCLEAFHALYPLGFAMFTAPDKRVPNGVKVCCPAGKAMFSLFRRPFRQISYLPEQIVRRLASLIVDCEVLRWRIFIRVESVQDCPFGQKVGEEFEINIGNTDDLCPAAANNFTPYFAPVIANNADGGTPAQPVTGTDAPRVASTPLIACPDHITDVKAVVRPDHPNGAEVFCQDLAKVSIKIEKTDNGLPSSVKPGDTLAVPQLLDKIGLPCLSYINVISPYTTVLREGGKLGYYTRNYRSAIVQCPNPDVKVVTRIESSVDGHDISYHIISNRAGCPLEMSTGAVFTLKHPEGYFWLRAAAVLSPYLLNISLLSKDTTAELYLVENGASAIFRIQKSE